MVYTYAEIENEKGESKMKYRTRARIAIAGVGLMCAAALYGAVYKITKSYPVQYTVKCEPIDTTKIEYQQDDDDTITTEIKLEPQIEEQESESAFVYEPPFHLTEHELWFVECVIAGECVYEPYEGKLAVAQCYFDAMLKDGLSATEVKSVYGYSGWNENLANQDPKVYDEVKNAVMDVFYGGKFVTEKPILFFYAPAYGRSDWHEDQEYWKTLYNHKFFYLEEDIGAEWCEVLKHGEEN